MRLVLDTNVLISATFWNGASAKIIDLIDENKIIGITSNEILIEYNNVLLSEEIQNKTTYLVDCSLKIKSLLTPIITYTRLSVVVDPDDNIILECALDGDADFIITYDKHLLNIKEFRGVKIVTPEKFINYSYL